MRELEYPFDTEYILKKSKSIKRDLLSDGTDRIHKKIAVLGGSTTHDIIRMMELFLLNQGIEAEFYESEYAQYWQDIMFDNQELNKFSPDVIYIHTTYHNITSLPQISDTPKMVSDKLNEQITHFNVMWDKIREKYRCPIIQNNFELPGYRLLGNMDATDVHGRVRMVNELNRAFAEYASDHEDFYINDINYQSACYGLDKWEDAAFWHMYKYALSMEAIPVLAFNVANIIKSIFGKNKKALVLDLDNTLWGGVVGDDGVENLELGKETPEAEAYTAFQTYLKELKDTGVLLNIDSKNDEENALAGLNSPDSVLRPDDFISIKANWEPKSTNLTQIAKELNLGEDSFVFVDDNPAEREIIIQQNPAVSIAEISSPEKYIREIDRAGYFETTKLSEDDMKRNEMYKANAMRASQQASFADYDEYLRSLEMKAQIKPFCAMYFARIAQLTNKSNQFNLTTKRFTQSDIERFANDSSYITLYGRLEDKFGDNGVVSVVIARIDKDILHIELWLMSCRVLKRDMEYAMMDELVKTAKVHGIKKIAGYYYKTAKNGMVKDFYSLHGFTKTQDDGDDSVWSLDIDDYIIKNPAIAVNRD